MDKTNFDTFFSNYFSDLEINNTKDKLKNNTHSNKIKNDIDSNNLIHNENNIHPNLIHNNNNHNKDNHNNRLIDDQLNNSKIVYNSVHLQFIFYFIATCILIGFIFIINASGNLSIFIIISLLIVLFLIFTLLKFNIVNFIMNFKM